MIHVIENDIIIIQWYPIVLIIKYLQNIYNYIQARLIII